jgi:GTP-binding protein HflX
MTLDQFEKSWIAKENAPAVFISAQEKNNISKLRQILLSELFKSRGKKID